jgi:hypothetical protein
MAIPCSPYGQSFSPNWAVHTRITHSIKNLNIFQFNRLGWRISSDLIWKKTLLLNNMRKYHVMKTFPHKVFSFHRWWMFATDKM